MTWAGDEPACRLFLKCLHGRNIHCRPWRETMRTIASVITAAAIFGGTTLTAVQAQGHTHVTQTVTEAKWGPAPPMLPPGAQIAVLSGDPGKSAPYAVRLKFPANYIIPAHSHPTDENV